MKSVLCLILFVSSLTVDVKCQVGKQQIIGAIGIDYSVGKNTFHNDVIQGINIVWSSNVRYRCPNLRLNVEYSYRLIPKFSTGTKILLNLILEDKYTYITRPNSILKTYSSLSLGLIEKYWLNSKNSIQTDIGYTFKNLSFNGFEESGGGFIEVSISKNIFKNTIISIGYRFQSETVTANWDKIGIMGLVGTSSSKQYRNTIFVQLPIIMLR